MFMIVPWVASTNKTTIAMNKLLAIVLSINENGLEVQ